jgi:hypothetical protein
MYGEREDYLPEEFPNTTNTYAKQAWFFGAACSDQLLLEHTGSSLDLPR